MFVNAKIQKRMSCVGLSGRSPFFSITLYPPTDAYIGFEYHCSTIAIAFLTHSLAFPPVWTH